MKRGASGKPSGASGAKKAKKMKHTQLEAVSTPVVKHALKILYGFPFNTPKEKYVDHILTVNKKYIGLKDIAKDVDTHDVIIIKSPMGSGKTTLTLDLFKSHPRILIISSRRSYSSYMCTVVPGLVNYLDIEGDISAEEHPRVIIQLQSLKRIKSIRTETTYAQWGCVYIDEINAVLSETISTVSALESRRINVKFLCKLVSNIPTAIVTDAGLAPWHLSALHDHLISGLSSRRKFILVNEHRPMTHKIKVFDSCLLSCRIFSGSFISQFKTAVGKEHSLLLDIETFFLSKQHSAIRSLFVYVVNKAYKKHSHTPTGDLGDQLRRVIRQKKQNAVVICNTKNQANLVGSFLGKILEKNEYLLLTGDTPKDVKDEFMANPAAALSSKRCLVHTTCVSVGVDLNFDWATETFLIVDAMTVNETPRVIDLFQATGRNRRSSVINLYVHGRRNYPTSKSMNKPGLVSDHNKLLLGQTSEGDPIPSLRAGSNEGTFYSDIYQDSLDCSVYKMNKLEREFNASPRLFFDVLMDLFAHTIQSSSPEYIETTWEDSFKFFNDETYIVKAIDKCKELFSKHISRYTSLSMDSFNDIFKGSLSKERTAVLGDIQQTIHLFSGDFPTTFFVLRHVNKHLLKQWAVYYKKVTFIEPTSAVNMLNFDEECAMLIDPDNLVERVTKRLFINNRCLQLKTYADFVNAIELTHSLLDSRTLSSETQVSLSRLLINEYEHTSDAHKLMEEISKVTGLTIHTDVSSPSQMKRFIMPVRDIKVDLHKMAALLLT